MAICWTCGDTIHAILDSGVWEAAHQSPADHIASIQHPSVCEPRLGGCGKICSGNWGHDPGCVRRDRHRWHAPRP